LSRACDVTVFSPVIFIDGGTRRGDLNWRAERERDKPPRSAAADWIEA
jgi:hypothetical protein